MTTLVAAVMLTGMQTLASRVRRTRTKLGLSARGLDAVAGLSPGHTALIESGQRREVSAATVFRLAEALSVTAQWLLDGRR